MALLHPLSIYVHIPFCREKCAYCDFNSIPVKSEEQVRAYMNALQKEIMNFAEKHSGKYRVETIYLGGGTPSVIPHGEIEKILGALQDSFHLNPSAEITIEVNPGTAAKEKFKRYAAYGINRVSIGAQSFIDDELRLLGRIHGAKEIYDTYKQARDTGIKNISLDLIYGLPRQDTDSLNYSTGKILRLDPEHISTYSLTIEKGTKLSRGIKSGRIPAPDDETQAGMFKSIIERFHDAGYIHYEISNFARKSFESKHNLSYWTGKDYAGFGAGAHSYMDGIRHSNTSDPAKYAAKNMITRRKKLSDKARFWENIVLGLRVLKGVEIGQTPQGFEEKIRPLIDKGLLARSGKDLRLSDKGILFYDTVAVELL